jgi:hypothetical protein
MDLKETAGIFSTAERLYEGSLRFERDVVDRIADLSDGYPYLAQLMGKACVNRLNDGAGKQLNGIAIVDMSILDAVLADIKSGQAFPTLEASYQKAIGNSVPRQILLTLLAEQKDNLARFNDELQRVVLRNVRPLAQEFQVEHVDQLIPRLVDKNYGPALVKDADVQGAYEFENPVFRAYGRRVLGVIKVKEGGTYGGTK